MLLRARRARFKERKDWEDISLIRRSVFTEEQGIDPRIDFDGLDATAMHVIDTALDETKGIFVPAGTVRFRPIDGPLYTLKLERMAVLPQFRKAGVGRHMLDFFLASFPGLQNGRAMITLHAQQSAQGFYERLGFEVCGKPFEEAGITHIEMQKVVS